MIWLIGMSASGKTTIGQELCRQIKADHPNTVFLDGDNVRYMMGEDLGHAVEDRRRNAARISRICRFLDSQQIHVVAAVLSIFHEWQDWNRRNFSSYFEIYLRVSLDTLIARDPRGLYERALAREVGNVVGVDIPFPPPKAPDLILDNDHERVDVRPLAGAIRSRLPI